MGMGRGIEGEWVSRWESGREGHGLGGKERVKGEGRQTERPLEGGLLARVVGILPVLQVQEAVDKGSFAGLKGTQNVKRKPGLQVSLHSF